MATMMTIKEAAHATRMSEYAIRKGVRMGIYPAIRVCGNPQGKILVNIDEFTATLNAIANRNIADDEVNPAPNIIMPIRRIAQ